MRPTAARCSTPSTSSSPTRPTSRWWPTSATAAGLDGDDLYFDVETVGNVSAASIPIAIHDAVREGVIDRPMRVFTPAFGAGAVGGYTVIRVDPAIVVPEGAEEAELLTAPAGGGAGSLEDVRAAFGG